MLLQAIIQAKIEKYYSVPVNLISCIFGQGCVQSADAIRSNSADTIFTLKES